MYTKIKAFKIKLYAKRLSDPIYMPLRNKFNGLLELSGKDVCPKDLFMLKKCRALITYFHIGVIDISKCSFKQTEKLDNIESQMGSLVI